jgi:hypothetical protein
MKGQYLILMTSVSKKYLLTIHEVWSIFFLTIWFLLRFITLCCYSLPLPILLASISLIEFIIILNTLFYRGLLLQKSIGCRWLFSVIHWNINRFGLTIYYLRQMMIPVWTYLNLSGRHLILLLKAASLLLLHLLILIVVAKVGLKISWTLMLHIYKSLIRHL